MSVDIVRGANNKPVSSKELDRLLSNQADLSGTLFIGYPIISTPGGRHKIDAIFIGLDTGIVIFDLVEGKQINNDYEQRQDDSANKLEARLKTHSELMRRRELRVPIHTISFAAGITGPCRRAEDGYQIANRENLIQALKDFHWQGREESVYKATLSAIENISTIRRGRTKRATTQEGSRGARLKRLENSIATLDNTQSKAVIETVEGVQRIRGLAGSGKTLILALKAAYLHAQRPEWRIALTFNTRSLKGHFRRLVNSFSIEQTGEEPDWANLRIVNAWGAPGEGERDGIYYEFCRVHGVEYFDFGSARSKFSRGKEFSGACEQAIGQARESRHIYDAILVDEAQDFPKEFLQLCYNLLNDHKRLVYAYDELQNLSGEFLPAPEEIFGKTPDGTPLGRFDNTNNDEPCRDIVLEKCYRNSRPVLATAHALGFGIYRTPQGQGGTGLVRMFEHSQLWGEIGYRRKEGQLVEGSPVTLYRSKETSPKFLEDHSDLDDLVRFVTFGTEEEQAKWLIKAIRENLEYDELRHDDIIVINPDPIKTRNKTGPIRSQLLELGISSHLAGVDTDPDIFFQSNVESVTFTGIYRAKGNEAGMVYIINAQDCHSAGRNLAGLRNRLFTAITRSKAWVRVLGVGKDMKELINEYEKLKARNFELQFTYPTREQRQQLRIVHRDMTTGERNRLESREKNLVDLINDLESGSIHAEDLDEKLVARFKEFFKTTDSDHANPQPG